MSPPKFSIFTLRARNILNAEVFVVYLYFNNVSEVQINIIGHVYLCSGSFGQSTENQK